MDRLALLLIGLVFGGGIGFVVAAGTGATLDGHDHAEHGSEATVTGHDAHAGTREHQAPHPLPLDPDVPTIGISLTRDAVSGWNLKVATRNFVFAPERAGAAHAAGEGHAHVHVDGAKIARLYGPWMHLPALSPGATVEVTLNANDHRPLAVHGHAVTATAIGPEE